ncbi:MAG: alpha-amylase family glycosyl hydrolase [Promethearchaeota archaeon]
MSKLKRKTTIKLTKSWPKHPKIFQINTWPWLNSLSKRFDKPITLNNIPEEIYEGDLKYFDAIWLMGVWERSPKGREIALNHPDLQAEYHNALNDFTPEDVVGSPYSVFYYHVDSHLGGSEGLAAFRMQLMGRDKFLILDYVPNHVSVDHIWTLEKSNMFITGTKDDLIEHSNEFFTSYDIVYAHGRDPYFPPWTDTVQINAFSPVAREKAIKTLINIASKCDGVRCDMAMLVTNEVFSNIWGERAGPIPKREFWEEIIQEVQNEYPHFIFLAEVYWDMEWKLQQQGFNFCYDKKLYERLTHEDINSVKAHLNADWDYQKKLLRFIENHDEERAYKIFGQRRSQVAAVIALTLPGARLIHEGQMKGSKIKVPVQLGRKPLENDNVELFDFYQRLLKAAPDRVLGEGEWSLCEVEPLTDYDQSYLNLIAYQWNTSQRCQLIVVNYSPFFGRAHVRLKKIDYGPFDWIFIDTLNHKTYTYNGKDLEYYGIYVDLNSWSAHIFEVRKKVSREDYADITF